MFNLSAAGDRQQQSDLCPRGEVVVAGHVLARDDREHRSQCGREVRLILREPGEEVADGGALGNLDSLERRGREAREPSAETYPYRQSVASLTARREYRREVSGVPAARPTTARVPTTSVAMR